MMPFCSISNRCNFESQFKQLLLYRIGLALIPGREWGILAGNICNISMCPASKEKI
jgi:hypothetical protein